MDQLAAMRVFRKVAECGSFNMAAGEIGLSNAAVSKQVQKLESHLGAQLMHRTTRRLSLTEAGKTYLEHCASILDSVAESEMMVGGMQVIPRGRLRLALPLLFGTRYVAPILPEFLVRYPEVQVDCELADRFVDIIEEGFDIALRIVTELPDSALVARRLGVVSRVACATPGYFRAHGIPKTPQDLAGHDCVRHATAAPGGYWKFGGPEGEQRVKVSGTRRVSDSIGARAAVAAGYGIALLPRFMVDEDLQAGRLVAVLDRFPAEHHWLWALRPKSRHESAKVRAFVEFLVRHFGRVPPWEVQPAAARQQSPARRGRRAPSGKIPPK